MSLAKEAKDLKSKVKLGTLIVPVEMRGSEIQDEIAPISAYKVLVLLRVQKAGELREIQDKIEVFQEFLQKPGHEKSGEIILDSRP